MSTPGRRDEVRAGLQVSARLPVAQSYLERRPSQALAGLVSSVWIQRASPGTAPFTHRNFPNGSVEFPCEVGSVPQIVGPRTRPRVEVLPRKQRRRYPSPSSCSGLVLGVPASELAGLALDAEDLWGRAPAVPEARLNGLVRSEPSAGVAFDQGAPRPGDRSGAVRSHGHRLCPIRRAAARAHNCARAHNWKIWREVQRSQPTLTVANIRRSDHSCSGTPVAQRDDCGSRPSREIRLMRAVGSPSRVGPSCA